MKRARTAIAGCLAVGALAALPTGASASSSGPSDPCVTNPNLPTCVTDVFDRADGGLETVRGTWNNDVQPKLDAPACTVYTILTNQPCPGLVPGL